MTEDVTVLSVDTTEAEENIYSLKEKVKALRLELNDESASVEQNAKTLDELREAQDKLKDAMNSTAKTTDELIASVDTMDGSYNSLVHTMAALKTRWRETTDEAERARLGEKIGDINSQLKEMDGSIGNFQRNVGNYEGAMQSFMDGTLEAFTKSEGRIGDVARRVKDLVTAFRTASAASVTSAKGAAAGIRAAMASTGVGGIIVLVGQLVGAFDKLKEQFKSSAKFADELKESTDRLNNSFERQNIILKNRLTIMEAEGATASELSIEESRLIRQQITDTQAQIDHYEGMLSAIRRKSKLLGGEKEEVTALKEEIAKLREQEQSLYDKQNELNTKRAADEIKARTATAKAEADAAAKSAADAEAQAAAEAKALQDRLAQTAATEEQYRQQNFERSIQQAQEWSEQRLSLERQQLQQSYNEQVAAAEATIQNEQLLNETLISLSNDYIMKREALEQSYREHKRQADEAAAEAERALEQQRTAEMKAEQQNRRMLAMAGAAATANILSSLAAIYESDSDDQEENAKKAKALKIAGATVDTLAGAIGAYMLSVATIPPPFGIISGIANAATVTAAGIAQIAQLKNTDVSSSGSTGSISSGSGSSYTPAAVQAPTIQMVAPQTSLINTSSTEQMLNSAFSDQRVYIVSSDIEADGRRVEVQQGESTF